MSEQPGFTDEAYTEIIRRASVHQERVRGITLQDLDAVAEAAGIDKEHVVSAINEVLQQKRALGRRAGGGALKRFVGKFLVGLGFLGVVAFQSFSGAPGPILVHLFFVFLVYLGAGFEGEPKK